MKKKRRKKKIRRRRRKRRRYTSENFFFSLQIIKNNYLKLFEIRFSLLPQQTNKRSEENKQRQVVSTLSDLPINALLSLFFYKSHYFLTVTILKCDTLPHKDLLLHPRVQVLKILLSDMLYVQNVRQRCLETSLPLTDRLKLTAWMTIVFFVNHTPNGDGMSRNHYHYRDG